MGTRGMFHWSGKEEAQGNGEKAGKKREQYNMKIERMGDGWVESKRKKRKKNTLAEKFIVGSFIFVSSI